MVPCTYSSDEIQNVSVFSPLILFFLSVAICSMKGLDISMRLRHGIEIDRLNDNHLCHDGQMCIRGDRVVKIVDKQWRT